MIYSGGMKTLHDKEFERHIKSTGKSIAAIRALTEASKKSREQNARLVDKPWPAWREGLEQLSEKLIMRTTFTETANERLEEKFGRLGEKMERTYDKIDWVDTRLSREISELLVMTKKGFDENSDRFTSIDGRLDTVDNQLKELRKDMKNILDIVSRLQPTRSKKSA